MVKLGNDLGIRAKSTPFTPLMFKNDSFGDTESEHKYVQRRQSEGGDKNLLL